MRKSSERLTSRVKEKKATERERLEKHNVSHIKLSYNLEGEKNHNKLSTFTRESRARIHYYYHSLVDFRKNKSQRGGQCLVREK
jgi:hypothetical protein